LYKYTASTFSAEMSQVGNMRSFADEQVMEMGHREWEDMTPTGQCVL